MALAIRTRTSISDYLSLAKPRVVLLHLITAGSAMFLAAGGLLSATTFLATLAGGGLVASASNALNCYFDRDIDGLMARTRYRSLPARRVKPQQALGFASAIGLTGLLILDLAVNWAVATLAAGALVYYILVYTLWLKRRTFWGAIVGSGAGAIPPLVGWLAVTGHVGPAAWLLSAIITLWTPPHFWALAIMRRQEYEAAGLRVIPARTASSWIAVCSVLLVTGTLALIPAAGLGQVYFVVTMTLGIALIWFAVRLWRTESTQNARWLFLYSILYLMALFAAMTVDRLVS